MPATAPIRVHIDTKLPWWALTRNVHDLWRWLEQQGDAPTDPAYYLEKPWKWEAEWNRMLQEQRGEAA